MRMLLLFTFGMSLTGCGGHQRKIKIPESVVQNPRSKRVPEPAVQPYVVKMSDGERVWEVVIPVSPGVPLNAAIPLDLGGLSQKPPGQYQTTADGEIIEAKKQAGEKVPALKPGEEATAQSYLATLARVKELFKRRQYEMALIDLVELDRQYPDDERILEMKGTLYQRLNRPKEAKKAWERVLSLNPSNETVARALERLEADEE
jgi:tetratricopeptide (TPR) repeat protein